MTAKKEESYMVPLGPHWIAVVYSTGHVDLQYQSKVIDCRGETYELAQLSPAQIESLEWRREDILVRTFRLSPEGSLWMDPHGVSPDGVLQKPFEYIPGPDEAAKLLLPHLLKNPREEY